jgi:two-component system phosphate regulon sensor histidine kinase PhoR
MSQGVLKELIWIVVTLAPVLFFGWLVDEVIAFILFYFIFYIARQLFNIRKFEHWIKAGNNDSVPPSSGMWQEIGYLVSRKQRSLKRRADLQFYKSEQFKAASMALDDAIVSIDKSGQMEWFNISAKKVLGLTKADIGTKLEYQLRLPDFIEYLRNENYSKPLILPSLQGTPRVFQVEVFRYFKNHKMIVFKDIHELYNSAQIRKDFIANASHELRTPLTVISGYLETMIDLEEPGSRWEKPLAQMYQQSGRMNSIINDLLMLSSLEVETQLGQAEIVDASELIQNLQDSYQQISDQHQFQYEIEDHVCLHGFPDHLISVFSNLMSNAIRYSPKGGIITVRLFSKNKNVFFEVEDNGIGIAQEHLARITERFYRVDEARSRETGGTGLGLAIVKQILEHHNAELIVKSQYGLGSTFCCKFPAVK